MLRPILITLATFALLAFYKTSDAVHIHGDVLLTTADRIAYTVCHRLPTHSFEIFGRTLPLCARCSGIYLGIVWGFGYLAGVGRLRHASYPSRRVLFILAALVLLMAVDGFNSLGHDMGLTTLYPPQNWLRLVTGMGLGIAIALIIAPTFAQTTWRDPIWNPPVATRRDAFILSAGAIMLILALLSGVSSIIYILALVSAAGVVLILMLLYAILVLLATRRDGQAARPSMLAAPLLGGVLLATAQIVGMALLRYELTGTWIGF